MRQQPNLLKKLLRRKYYKKVNVHEFIKRNKYSHLRQLITGVSNCFSFCRDKIFHSIKLQLKLNPIKMKQLDQSLTRNLNARERRRLTIHRMLPVDAIDPTCSNYNLTERHQTELLYRYGCGLAEMNVETEDVIDTTEHGNFFSRFRGFIIIFPSSTLRDSFYIHYFPFRASKKPNAMVDTFNDRIGWRAKLHPWTDFCGPFEWWASFVCLSDKIDLV